MQNVDAIVNHAEKSCKTNGARLTTKRKQVLSALLELDKALSAYELIELYKEAYGESMPATSMYRILDFLESESLVHKLKLANKYVACSHITCDHGHETSQFLICRDCQKVKEISIPKPTVKKFQSLVEDAGFRLLTPQLEMNCICEECESNVA